MAWFVVAPLLLLLCSSTLTEGIVASSDRGQEKLHATLGYYYTSPPNSGQPPAEHDRPSAPPPQHGGAEKKKPAPPPPTPSCGRPVQPPPYEPAATVWTTACASALCSTAGASTASAAQESFSIPTTAVRQTDTAISSPEAPATAPCTPPAASWPRANKATAMPAVPTAAKTTATSPCLSAPGLRWQSAATSDVLLPAASAATSSNSVVAIPASTIAAVSQLSQPVVQ
ncbi:predicted GPI-anchored protein 58 [Zingiber officinale]|uniref:predicted GPI-anchored protein 58 n=1 Tax=Zingiber officinale TaxID=94328 RepID=UPI001C4AEEC4|nr:predicted GPI-anchored protein 58 [Zingiber officinale]